MSYIGPVTQNILSALAKEFEKKETNDKIIGIIKPIVSQVLAKYMVYVYMLVIVQLIIILMLIYIIYKLNTI
jgi:hypothetical protein